jgi:hypothetical protein
MQKTGCGESFVHNCRYLLTPYRGVRYHLKEWKLCNLRPQTKEELFNLRHASLRNIIERAFGILKKRFPIFELMHSYSLHLQINLVLCGVMIHNYIRRNQGYEDEYDNIDDDVGEVDNEGGAAVEEEEHHGPEGTSAWRDQIATEMWEQYQEYIINNNGNNI